MEEEIIAKLLATSGVSLLVAARVYPVSRPQGSALPAITLGRISGAPLYADDGETGLETSRVQIDCWGATYTSAKTVARAVVASLSAFVGSSCGVDFKYVLLDAERDIRESGANSEEYPFRTSLDFIVWNDR
jgi:hypothetical protein